MEYPEDVIWKNIGLYQRHLNLLEHVNENPSIAARTILDSIINGQDRLEKKRQIDGVLTFVALGLMFFFISYLLDNFVVVFVCTGIGVFLFAYGTIGGIVNALSGTKKKKKYQQ